MEGSPARTTRGRTSWLVSGGLLILLVMTGTGCTHALEIHRYGDWALVMDEEDAWPPSISPDIPIRVGHLDADPGNFAREILDGVEGGRRVVGGGRSESNGVEVDVHVRTNLSGGGINYWIAFPGFLIFAPKLSGFHYHWMYEFTVVYRFGGREPEVVEFSCGYQLRHTSFGRGFATIGAGWLITWVSPLIAGFFYIGYEDGYTGYFLEVAEPEVPDVIYYATQRIYSELNRLADSS